jgi:hypothetical protein
MKCAAKPANLLIARDISLTPPQRIMPICRISKVYNVVFVFVLDVSRFLSVRRDGRLKSRG